MRRSLPLWRVGASLALAIGAMTPGAIGATPALAQGGLTITTPYPAVSVQPGASVSLVIDVASPEAQRVDLTVEDVPDGWQASLSGGGNEVSSAFVAPGAPAELTLTVSVADDATAGTTRITISGSGASGSASLPVDLEVADSGGGTVSIESDYPSLQGTVGTDFQFNLTLHNDTPQQLTFSLDAQGPSGWDVSIQPTGQTRAASVTVDAHGTQRLEVKATPPEQASADTYPIAVAVNAGQYQATSDLAVEVTGSVRMDLSTPDQRLNTNANAGAATDFQVVVTNSGTSTLNDVSLVGTGPTDWDVTFDPEAIPQLAAGDSATVTAHITPSGSAVAGDYQVRLAAQSADTNEALEIRVTVETAPIWGIVGAALILATLAGMVWIFRRYGRR